MTDSYRATFGGLGAIDEFEMAPFATEDERAAYFKRVQELREELKRVREKREAE